MALGFNRNHSGAGGMARGGIDRSGGKNRLRRSGTLYLLLWYGACAGSAHQWLEWRNGLRGGPLVSTENRFQTQEK